MPQAPTFGSKTYWYSTSARGELRYELQGTHRELRDVATDAAEDFHGNHDGWESAWPLDFYIYESEEGPAVARFEVEREVVPQFFAWEREQPAPPAAVDPQARSHDEPSPRVKDPLP